MFQNSSGGIELPEPSRAMRKTAIASKGHFTGHLVTGARAGRVIEVESHLEMQVALVLLANRHVADLDSQVAFDWRDVDGNARTHFFDFMVHMWDGNRFAIAVKPKKRLQDGRFRAEMSLIAEQVEPWFANGVRIFTEEYLDPTDLHNAELFHAVREPDPEADAAAAAVAVGIAGSVRLRDLAEATGLGTRGFRAFIRLLRNHRLAPVKHERITRDTSVYCRGTF